MPEISKDIEYISLQANRYSKEFVDYINGGLSSFSPLELLILTLAFCICFRYLLQIYEKVRLLGIMTILFRFATKLPFIRDKVAAEENKIRDENKRKFEDQRKATSIKELPMKPLSHDEILKRLNLGEKVNRKCYVDGGLVSGGVYISDEKHWDFIGEVMRKYIVANPLHMDEFKTVTQMEAEIIRWIANLYNGDQNSCGVLTSGGTESILLACLAYREKAKARGVTKPNMVLNNTAHAAFDKACFYF